VKKEKVILNLPTYFKFLQWIDKKYRPFTREFYRPEETVYQADFYTKANARRLYLILRYFNKYFPAGGKSVLDIGCYPGSILKMLREFCTGNVMILLGCGLVNDDGFVQEMQN